MAAASDFEGGFSTELCKGVTGMAVDLGKQVGLRVFWRILCRVRLIRLVRMRRLVGRIVGVFIVFLPRMMDMH